MSAGAPSVILRPPTTDILRLYRARWVLPISSRPIADGTVGVEAGRIVWVGPASDAPPGNITDFGSCVLLPGLVNAHTHLELTAMRGLLEEVPFHQWITRLTNARRAISRERLLASARIGIAEGLLGGITTYADTCESGVVHQAMREMGVRGVMFQEVFGPRPADRDVALRGLRERIDALLPLDTALVRTGISPHAPYSVCDALFSATTSMAKTLHLRVAIHAAESDDEHRLVRDAQGEFADALRARGIAVRPRGRSTIDALHRNGALGVNPLLIHCVRVDEQDIALMVAKDCTIAHCPASNAKLGHGIAPLAEWLKAGIAVGLGSDSVASNNRMDLLDESRTAILMQRARGGTSSVLDAPRALELATRGSARALGLDGEIGSLEVGKSADLAAFELDALADVQAYEPEAALVYGRAGRRARFVMVAGEMLVCDGSLRADMQFDQREMRLTSRELEGIQGANGPSAGS